MILKDRYLLVVYSHPECIDTVIALVLKDRDFLLSAKSIFASCDHGDIPQEKWEKILGNNCICDVIHNVNELLLHGYTLNSCPYIGELSEDVDCEVSDYFNGLNIDVLVWNSEFLDYEVK